MNNKIYLNAGIALLAALGLAACNGGNSTSTSNNAPQTSELQQYINSLAYTPAGGKQLADEATSQQSFTTPGGVKINSVDIQYFSGTDCTGLIANHTLAGSVTPNAGTYTSTSKSNFALCTDYQNGSSTGCGGMWTDMRNNALKSVRYIYNIDNGEGGVNPIMAQCMYNPSAEVGPATGVEGIANWNTATNNAACSDGNPCGYSQPYSVSLGGCSSGSCDIFATSTTYNFNLLGAANNAGATVTTGVAGADYLCQLAANNNESATPGMYKALLGASTRQPPATDWVLKANYNYVFINYDGTKPSFATNANSIFESFGAGNAPLSFSAFASLVQQPPVLIADTYVFTGLDNDFIYTGGGTCSDWTAASMCMPPSAGGTAWDTATGDKFIASTMAIPGTPTTTARLYCVQQ